MEIRLVEIYVVPQQGEKRWVAIRQMDLGGSRAGRAVETDCERKTLIQPVSA